MKFSSMLPAAMLVALLACGTQSQKETSDGAQSGPSGSVPLQFFPIEGDFAASHILIAFKEAQRARPEVTRDKEEARIKAQQLLERLKEEPGLIATLARQESDGPSGPRGGYLGGWKTGAMVPEFQTAVEGTGIGELVPEPVETPFGFHIIRREPMSLKHYGCLAFFIPYKGSQRVPATISRTKEEAEAIAGEVEAKLTAENFDQLAMEYNELNEGKGAFVLAVMTERDDVPFPINETLGAIDYGQITGPVPTEVGFAFLKRTKVMKLAGAHILLAYQGAAQTEGQVSRSKEEAQAKAEELLGQLKADPSQFENLAKEHSDGPSGPNGGDLGTWFKGRMVGAFDEAILKISPGEIVDQAIETQFGFHIIKRNAIEGPAEGASQPEQSP